MKRITNVDTLAALLDRLIAENIKLFFFAKENQAEKVAHQDAVISELRLRIVELFNEVLTQGTYDYIGEKRTFSAEEIVEELEELIINDINIGESDRARLAAATAPTPNLERMVINEKRLRKANEGRSRNKNRIDQLLAEGVE